MAAAASFNQWMRNAPVEAAAVPGGDDDGDEELLADALRAAAVTAKTPGSWGPSAFRFALRGSTRMAVNRHPMCTPTRRASFTILHRSAARSVVPRGACDGPTGSRLMPQPDAACVLGGEAGYSGDGAA